MARRTAALVALILLQTGVHSATTLARRRLGEVPPLHCSCKSSLGLQKAEQRIECLMYRQVQDLDTLVSVSVDAKAQELQQLQQWVAETPHAPGAELTEALGAAAWKPATTSSKGFVILNSGKYAVRLCAISSRG